MVFNLHGSNLLDLIRLYDYHGIPQPAVKYITRQILEGLDFLHKKCRIIHTDIKPENILLCQTITREKYLPALNPCALAPVSVPEGKDDSYSFERLYQIKIADFGNANWVSMHFTDDIQTRQYRSPEVILGSNWTWTVDLWSVACMVFELLTGDFLFDPKAGPGYEKEDDHLALMIELLGKMPPVLRVTGRKSERYFTRKGDLIHISKDELHMSSLREHLLVCLSHFPPFFIVVISFINCFCFESTGKV